MRITDEPQSIERDSRCCDGQFCAKANLVYLRRAEVAARLKIDQKTLANWASKGIGPPVERLGGRLVRYELGLLLAWEAER